MTQRLLTYSEMMGGSPERRARARLLDFATYTMAGYQQAQHLSLLAEKLESIERGELERLIVIMPPRHGKTEMASIRFPAWYLGRHPQAQVIGCSYAEGLAYTISYAVRETIMSPQYQHLWPLSLAQAGAVRWQLTGKGDNRASYLAAGVGGGITGEGADLLIWDDPIRSAEEANSALQRDKIWAWWQMVARTRLQPGAAVILITTRWHLDDPAGRLLAQAAADPKADQWEVLHLRAVEGGRALWPERYPMEALEKIRLDIGPYNFATLYQGEPAYARGNIFRREWWQYYSERPTFTRVIHSWDTAFKEKEGKDYSVCMVVGVAQTGYYILDVWRGRPEFPELKRVAESLAARDSPSLVVVEDKASGQSLLQELRRNTRLPVKAVKADADKVLRANAITGHIEAGRVFLPQSAPWVHDFAEELSSFPAGPHDDQVDALVYAISELTQGGAPNIGFW